MKRLTTCAAYGLLLALPALLGGCWGKCTDSLFSADQRAYFIDFKPGDYWIYRNVANGDIDSVYYAGQESLLETNPPNCRAEAVTVQFNGFAKSLIFAYYIRPWDGTMAGAAPATLDFYGNYDTTIPKAEQIAGRTYAQTIVSIDCTRKGCVPNPSQGFSLERLTFARSVGLVKWEAIQHPKFGTVTYELIRSNRLS
jgi:hypothetical protein